MLRLRETTPIQEITISNNPSLKEVRFKTTSYVVAESMGMTVKEYFVRSLIYIIEK